MRLSQNTDAELAPELEAIATAAAEPHGRTPTAIRSVRRRSCSEASVRQQPGRSPQGVSLAAIADAERLGQQRARDQLGREVLRTVERAAQRKREDENTYEQAVLRAARLGLAHRDVAQAAQVAHGTVRAILRRTQTALGTGGASTMSAAIFQADLEQQPADSS